MFSRASTNKATTNIAVATTRTDVRKATITVATNSRTGAGTDIRVNTAISGTKRRAPTSASSNSTLETESKQPSNIPILVWDRDPKRRPATTGKEVGFRLKREAEAKRKKEEAINCLEREVEDLRGGIFRLIRDKRPLEEVFKDTTSMALLREAGSTELTSEAGRAIGAVRLVARGSKMPKGTFVLLLNRAAAASEAVLLTLIARVAAQDGGQLAITEISREMEELREELRALRVENWRLQEEQNAAKLAAVTAGEDTLVADTEMAGTSRSRKKRKTMRRRVTKSPPRESSSLEEERGEAVGEIKVYDDNLDLYRREEATTLVAAYRPPKKIDIHVDLRGSVDPESRDLDPQVRRIKPADLGIPGSIKVRRALTGVLLIEVPGLNTGAPADRLVEELCKLVAEKVPEYRVQRPVRTAALRITGLNLTVGAQEVAEAVSLAGGCSPMEVSVSELSVAQRGTAAVVVRCPQVAAAKVVAAERAQVDWTRARVTGLPARAVLCYRCLERGHVREQCRNAVDRSNTCYRSGNPGHRTKDSEGSPKQAPEQGDTAKPGPREQRAPRKRGATSEDVTVPADLEIGGETGPLEAEKANLGRGHRIQDLLVHGLIELAAGLEVVTEPSWIPVNNPELFGSRYGLVAMMAHPASGSPPCKHRKQGTSYMSVDWGSVTVVEVYLPHCRNRAGLGELPPVMGILDEVKDVVRRCHPRPVVVAETSTPTPRSGVMVPGRGIPGTTHSVATNVNHGT
ncbi:uncharacterized protein LOC105184114 [Harpegnathos saltator]|uniref:uncharacterized protein LOC105184114 n=1 Tax=Harpegnathos saltator TaxID=610380 RepID=UPI000DBECEE5|nr:uncharacterized protein LOC105184114 [Harpegnathos saltator]